MNVALFPDAEQAGSAVVPASDVSGAPGRWVLHRAGIVNVWQYDRVELRFAGGRLLLRGKNGAGKSKALEVMLPFLFDGDTRRLDATGRDRTTVKWLMTDGRAQGNHVGYVWLELRCGDIDGSERFHTLGAGLKASTAAGRTDAWFFGTERRVGVDFVLDRAGECLSVDRLRERLGDEAVTTSGIEHRRRVARHLFGLFDDARYDNLMHLLHRLRDPNIGNRVEAGELAGVLSDALPPIDERVLTDAAARFDDLESIREQVERADRTAHALGQFLGVYQGYARTVLGRRAEEVDAAEDTRSKAERETNRARRAADEATTARAARDGELTALRDERGDRDGERKGLEASEGYRAHLDLSERQRSVELLDQAARRAATTAARSALEHDRAVADVAAAEHELGEQLDAVAEAAGRADGWLVAAGVGAGALGPQPVVSASGPLDAVSITGVAQRSQSAATTASIRGERASEVRVLAVVARRTADAATTADARAAESESAVESERRAVHIRTEHRAVAEADWASAVRSWTRSGVAATCGADWEEVEHVLDAERTDDWVESVVGAVGAGLERPLGLARRAAAATQVAVEGRRGDVAAAQSLVESLEQQTEARPAVSRFRAVERDPAAGAPFYELVELRDGVDESIAAGLEAALESSGLLDAWVTADGVIVHPRTHDVIVAADGAPIADGASLAAVLRPAELDRSAVSSARVAAVLHGVGWGEHAGAATWMAGDGRWSVGALRGAWSKPGIEFVGAGARRATRRRQLADARVQLAQCAAALDAAVREAEEAAAVRDAIEGLPGSLPATTEMADARRAWATAQAALSAALARYDTDRRAAETARARAAGAHTALADKAAADALPITIEELDRIDAAIVQAGGALREHHGLLTALTRLVERIATLARRVAERAEDAAHDDADAARTRVEHERSAAELAALRAALGASVQEVLARHGVVVARIAELDSTTIPAADQAVRAAVATEAGLRVRAEEAARLAATAVEALDASSGRLRAALALDGFLLAATGRDMLDQAVDGVALAAAVGPLVDGGDPVGDSLVLSRYDRLNEALAGGYDTAIDEVDGIKVVYVDDDSGRRPLAVVAAVLDEEAKAARGRLAAREREVLERFLLRELADEVRGKLLDAHDLVTGTNRTLAGVRTSHGKGAHLEWRLRDDAPSTAATATRLLVDRLGDADGTDRDTALREALLALIEAERAADPSASYEQHLRQALDYRTWHRFAVKVSDAAHPGSLRTLSNRLGLSQGEQRVLAYLALFAAAASHFEAIARDAPHAPRLLLLDDAFAKVDEPTHGQLLGLLVDLDLDVVLTSERLWGCFPTVPGLEIYEAIRDPATPGVALVHFHWDGHRRTLVPV
jgi:uncharacterized protein (TIGR02680 family)